MKCYWVLPVDVDGLQQAESHPGPQQEHVVTEDHDADEEAGAQDDSLRRMGVFCLHAKRGLEDSGDAGHVFTPKEGATLTTLFVFMHLWTHSELVMDFVDESVDPAVMQRAMEEVVPGVFNDGATEALSQEVRPGRRERKGRGLPLNERSWMKDTLANSHH